MCGLILVLILVMATWVAWFQPGSLKDVIGFFATVVATLGTLLDGVVAFLLQPALTRVTPGRAGPAVPGRG